MTALSTAAPPVIDDERLDAMYKDVMQQRRGVEPLLGTVFSFLRRKTPFFADPDAVQEAVLKVVQREVALAERDEAKGPPRKKPEDDKGRKKAMEEAARRRKESQRRGAEGIDEGTEDDIDIGMQHVANAAEAAAAASAAEATAAAALAGAGTPIIGAAGTELMAPPGPPPLRFSWKGKEVRNMHELHKEVLEYDSELSSLMERVSAIKDVSLSSLAMLKSVSRRDVQEMLQLSNIHACGMMLVLEELQRIGAPEPMPANPGMYKGPGPFGEHDVFDLDLARRGEGPSHGFRGPGGPGMPGMGPGMPGGPVSGSKPRSRAAGELDDGPYPGPRGPGKKGRFDHMGGGGKGGGGQGGGIEDEAWAQQYLEQLQPYKRVFCGKITKLTVDHLHRRSQKWKEALHFLESKSPAGYVQAMAVDRLLGVSKSARADWVHWDAVLENQNYPFDDPQAAAVYVSELKKEVVRIKGKAYSLKKGMLAEQQEERANAAAAAAAMANVGQFGGPSHP